MKKHLVAVLLVVAVVAGLLASPAAAAQDHGPGYAPADQLGRWKVGLDTIDVVVNEAAGRIIPVDIYYPVGRADARGVDPAVLDLLVTTYSFEVALDAPRPSPRGRFPVVVFSHGSSGIRAQSWFLMEHLASHGFVVVAPEHVGNTATSNPPDPFDVIARNRPRDISATIDEVLAMSADRNSRFKGLVDPARIAVMGHSFGGFTALAVAGGFRDYRPDPRVKAIVPIAAAARSLTNRELQRVTVPTLFLSGTDDITVPIGNTSRAWRIINSRRGHRVYVRAGGHNSFTNVCDLLDILIDAGLPPELLSFLVSAAEEGCAPELIDIDEAHRLTALYATAFLKSTIGGDNRYKRYLTFGYADRQDLPINYDRRPIRNR